MAAGFKYFNPRWYRRCWVTLNATQSKDQSKGHHIKKEQQLSPSRDDGRRETRTILAKAAKRADGMINVQ